MNWYRHSTTQKLKFLKITTTLNFNITSSVNLTGLIFTHKQQMRSFLSQVKKLVMSFSYGRKRIYYSI